MFISYHQGTEPPQCIQYEIRLGMKQYRISFDIQSVEDEEGQQYKWTEVLFSPGKPTYDNLVAAIICSRYSSDKMQAIINNHLLNDGNAEHEKEWNDMQEWRAEAKTTAKKVLSEIDS